MALHRNAGEVRNMLSFSSIIRFHRFWHLCVLQLSCFPFLPSIQGGRVWTMQLMDVHGPQREKWDHAELKMIHWDQEGQLQYRKMSVIPIKVGRNTMNLQTAVIKFSSSEPREKAGLSTCWLDISTHSSRESTGRRYRNGVFKRQGRINHSIYHRTTFPTTESTGRKKEAVHGEELSSSLARQARVLKGPAAEPAKFPPFGPSVAYPMPSSTSFLHPLLWAYFPASSH
jgi:hypothetical protein